jgi:hypothetical protein
VWARLDPCSMALEEGFTRDVNQIGHAGTAAYHDRVICQAHLGLRGIARD